MASSSNASNNPPLYSRAPPKMNTIIEEPSADENPIRPPGLLPLPGDRLWKPHEDKYWTNLREQWGSAVDLNDEENEIVNRDSYASVHLRQHVVEQGSSEEGGEGEDMHDIDLLTANGTVFRIVLAQGEHNGHEHDHGARDSGGNPSTRRSHEQRPALRHINHTPLTDAVSLHLPPPAVQKPPTKKGFRGNALNVSVTTSTRTYGDFSTMNPPPYTPRPTNAERSFGRNGKFSEEDKMANKWPVAKWLFVLGFVFPLLWLFGSFLMFSGLRKISADSQAESQDSNPSKFDTRPGDTNNVTHMIAREVTWSKRCAIAIVLFAVACFIVLGVLKAVGM